MSAPVLDDWGVKELAKARKALDVVIGNVDAILTDLEAKPFALYEIEGGLLAAQESLFTALHIGASQ